MSKTKRKASVADRIVQGLQEIADALENDKAISQRFTYRKVALDLQLTSYKSASVKKRNAKLPESPL
jgi:hypothetical protein